MFGRAKMPVKATIRDGSENNAEEKRHNSMSEQKAEKTEQKHKEQDPKNPEADHFVANDENIFIHFRLLLWFLFLSI